MTTNYHTAIAVGAAANAATFNAPLGQLDAVLGTLNDTVTNAVTGVYNVLDYGATGDGSTDDTTAVQAAITAASAGTVFFPSGNYKISTSLDCSGLRSGITLQGQHMYGTFISWYGDAGDNIVDLTNSQYIQIKDLTIQTGTAQTAKVGILMGRNASGNSSGNHVLTNVTVQGNITSAGIYSISSEINKFDGVHVYLTSAAGSVVYYQSDSNDLSVSSDYETFTALADNCTVTTFIGGSYCHWGASGGTVFTFNDCVNVSMHGTYMQSNETPTQLMLFTGTCRNMIVSAIRQEGTPTYGIKTTGTISSTLFSGCYLAGETNAVYGADGSTVQLSQFLGCTSSATANIYSFATVNYCLVDMLTQNATARTAALKNQWFNAPYNQPSLTGGVGNVAHSSWSDGATRMMINYGGVWQSDIGIGSSGAASATTPGNVIKKISVYDNTGSVIGYLAVYDAIA